MAVVLIQMAPFQFLFIYPINGLSAYSPAWYLMRVCPESETRTRIEMEYYKHKSLTDAEMDVFVEFGKQVQKEVCSVPPPVPISPPLAYANCA
jgi:hypothetical protein